ncbi:unnamed protein product [Paramecium octaurelia]|uniref:Uncharacterized protein n=1 Tax=Paramecium octaurelia TaxID=43137 RepID=A0A8S1V7S0_PAROT|nr:unnamed protein product [Paramecium octaurelia]
MSRENAIQYRSPQQIPSSKKPNIENCPPQRNTNEFIKQMKKRVDQAPLSVMTQNSQIKDAQSIFIDMSRIEQQSSNSNNSFYDPLKQPVLPQCHRSNQPSNCTTQRTNRYDMQRNSKPYLDQSENMGLLLIQQQMLSLQNENMNLKQQLEKQESQRLLFQQQLLQQFQTQQQQQQQPIVINNNITSFEKQQSQSKSIPPQHYQDETESPPKRIQGKKQQSQAIQTDKSVQDQSIITLNESFQNESLCNRSKQIISQQSQIRPPQQQKQSIESLTFGTQLSQRNLISQQSQQQLQIQTHNSQSRNQSYQQINQGSIELQTENTQKDCQIQNQRDISRKHSQIDIINSPALQDQSYCAYNPELPKKSQPSVKLEFNFDEGTNKGSNKKCLADYFTQRKKTTNFDRRVSVQAPIQEEDQSWIVNVKQRSKEEQIKLRKEMMEYGRNKRQQNKSQTPVNEDKISDRKEQIKKSKSPLMERLSMGQKAKVEEKEMFALTKKNYENLPEVKKKKNQEESIKQKQQFMRERQNKLKELDDKIKEKMKKP